MTANELIEQLQRLPAERRSTPLYMEADAGWARVGGIDASLTDDDGVPAVVIVPGD